jgi:hypothetical protein
MAAPELDGIMFISAALPTFKTFMDGPSTVY